MSVFKLNKIQSAASPLLMISAVFAALNYQGHDYSYRWNLLALFIMATLTLIFLWRNYDNCRPLKLHKAWILYSLYMLWSLAGLLWSAVPSDSLLFWSTQLCGVFALYLGYQARAEQWQVFKGLLLPIVLIVAGYTNYQAQYLHIQRPAGFLLNWNTNAAFIALLLLPLSLEFLRLEKSSHRLILGLTFTFCAIAIAATQSRGGVMVLILGLAPLLVLRLQFHSSRILQLIAYLMLGFILAEWLLNSGGLFHRVAQTAAQTQTQSVIQSVGSGRHALWAAAWKMYLDQPLLGWGLGMFHWLYPQYRNPLLLEKGQLAHNDYLDTLLGLGPVGLILLLAFTGQIAYLLYQAIRQKNADKTVLASAALAILIHSFFSFNLFQSAIIIVIGFFIGYLSQSDSDYTRIAKPLVQFDRHIYYGAIGAVALLFNAWLLSLMMGFYYADQSFKTQDPMQKMERLTRAQQWLPYMAAFDAMITDHLLGLLTQRKPQDMTTEEQKALVDFALSKVQDLLQKNSLDSAGYRKQAALLAFTANTPEQKQRIVSLYQKALQFDPYDLKTRLHLAAILEYEQREAEANRLLFEAFDKAYFENPKVGLQFLIKIKSLFETTRLTPEQEQKLQSQLDDLSNLAMHSLYDNFTLKNIGVPVE
jgi:O-antigen ligase